MSTLLFMTRATTLPARDIRPTTIWRARATVARVGTRRTFALARLAQTSMIAMASFPARELTTATNRVIMKAWFPMVAFHIPYGQIVAGSWMRPADVAVLT